MPISDPEGYPDGHFRRVYEDIFKPAIIKAGYEPKRADDVLETNLIQLDLLRRLLEAPMALCDLSSRNPNVLFELGIRQAFDKPVALVQEEDTPRIFDIAPLRATTYRRNRIYHEVLLDQTAISETITATRKASRDSRNVNSLVRLLGLSEPATIKEVKDAERDPGIQLVRAELAELRRELRLGGGSPRASVVNTVDRGPNPIPFVYGMYAALEDSSEFARVLSKRLGMSIGVEHIEPDAPNYPPGYTSLVRFHRPTLYGQLADAISAASTEMDVPIP